jgi:O-antigen ligase
MPGWRTAQLGFVYLGKSMPIATARLTGIRSRPFGYRPRREPLWSSRQAFLSDLALFLLGAAGVYSLSVVGSLPYSEVLLLTMLPALLLTRGRRAFDRQYLWFYILAGGWFLGTQIADIYNGIPSYGRMKGTARVVFFILDFIGLAILINNKTRKMLVFAMSLAALMFLSSMAYSSDFLLRWKFGLSHACAMMALLVSAHYYRRQKYGVCFAIALLLAVLNLAYGARSQLVIHVISAVLILPIFDSVQAQAGSARGTPNIFRVLILLVMAGGVAYAANAAIKYAAAKGIFDESTNSKFQTQSEGDYGVLVGGRPETLVAIQAIRDSPILGHGSFAFGVKYLELKQDLQYEHGYSDSDEPEDTEFPIIPTHSHLTLAWVEGGILGGIFWIYIFILVLRALLRLTSLRPDLSPLYAYLLVNFLWDILYSPFGSVNRMRAAFFILLSYFLLRSPAESAGVRPSIVKKAYRRRTTVRLAPVAASSPRLG